MLQRGLFLHTLGKSLLPCSAAAGPCQLKLHGLFLLPSTLLQTAAEVLCLAHTRAFLLNPKTVLVLLSPFLNSSINDTKSPESRRGAPSPRITSLALTHKLLHNKLVWKSGSPHEHYLIILISITCYSDPGKWLDCSIQKVVERPINALTACIKGEACTLRLWAFTNPEFWPVPALKGLPCTPRFRL